ncbi:helix-turn-helix domain-containing protein [Epibacterium sp. SM1969]|uniref:Helix-turn-helix domain-containing protein n=1 Tax=Tritonibacter aquimaris TaxID=2663379 RepID=A0A844AVV4_9RHOB|nr:helix-turn-helix domain-containing protein [Tritonibacter aquimaris]MQY41336.1 helix-turn-helix domain-containing protein [Tritonibacter aquimaris]
MLLKTPTATEIEITTLPRLAPIGPWQIELSHDRAQDLIVWITRGQGRVMIDGQQRGFGAHHVFYIPAGSLWSLDLGRQCIGRCLFLPRLADARALFLRIADSQIQAQINFMLERMQQEQSSKATAWQASMQALTQLVRIELQRTAAQDQADTRPTAAQRLCRAYCKRVSQFYQQGDSMSDHADALEVTPTHLTRVCKAETGKTAAALLTERQLHAARSLLTYSDTPVQEIAGRLGFGSPAYFTRFISQHTGMSPSRLRKSARSQ